ncbi:hypothetical protein D3C83_53780 [compost metagenome]
MRQHEDAEIRRAQMAREQVNREKVAGTDEALVDQGPAYAAQFAECAPHAPPQSPPPRAARCVGFRSRRTQLFDGPPIGTGHQYSTAEGSNTSLSRHH